MFPDVPVVTQVLYLLHPAVTPPAVNVQAVHQVFVLVASVHLVLAAVQPVIAVQTVHAADAPVKLNDPAAQEVHTASAAVVQDTTPVAGQPVKTQAVQVPVPDPQNPALQFVQTVVAAAIGQV